MRAHVREYRRLGPGTASDVRELAAAVTEADGVSPLSEHVMLHLRDMVGAVRSGTPPPLFSPTKGDRA